MLGTQAIEDPLDRMTLLAGRRFILLQDLVDDWQERIQLGSLAGLPLPIAEGLRMAQDLFESLPVEGKFFANRSFGFFLGSGQDDGFRSSYAYLAAWATLADRKA